MHVKLCTRCPYSPKDLASHYDSKAVLHACAQCDSEEATNGTVLPQQSSDHTQVLNGARGLRHIKRCAVCDGEFGRIRYRWRRTPLCSKKCIDRFKVPGG
jgi:hypothetical protein